MEKLNAWLDVNNADLQDSWFYSDSHNDLPLLNRVARPVAVDPDDILHQHALEHDWRIIDIRYSMIPNRATGLWAIEVSPYANAQEHAGYLADRSASSETLNVFSSMIFGTYRGDTVPDNQAIGH